MAHRADTISRSWPFLTNPPVPLHLLTLAPHVQIFLTWVCYVGVLATMYVPVVW